MTDPSSFGTLELFNTPIARPGARGLGTHRWADTNIMNHPDNQIEGWYGSYHDWVFALHGQQLIPGDTLNMRTQDSVHSVEFMRVEILPDNTPIPVLRRVDSEEIIPFTEVLAAEYQRDFIRLPLNQHDTFNRMK